ncbi:MAG: cysteine synthase A [Betaproteobacteria bacterium]|jgi:cysteine synthase A|nr:MAG: cysteine synthase A [Betaproteobacteria bacterium]
MDIRDGLVESIGNTPLIRLRKLSEQTGCDILGKAEFMNPGGSVKDRAGRYIIEDAEKKGLLGPGGIIVEGTAGNTGIGLTVVGNARGYKTIIVMPDSQSQEKKDALRLLGAELILVPAVPYRNPNQYQHVAKRLAEKLKNESDVPVLYADQWDNTANRDGHLASTGPEIWRQTGGKIDGFICAMGTGGTLSGVSEYLKSSNKNVTIGLADPLGASMFHYFKDGELKSTEGGSISEGIGQGRVTDNVAGAIVDEPFAIPDAEALPVLFDVLQHEGLCLGGSSAINLAGAVKLAEKLGPGKTIVTILCDAGFRYASKLWNPDFLRQKNLPVPAWLESQTSRDISDVLERPG